MKRITKKREGWGYELAAGKEIYADEGGIRLVQVVGEYEDIEEGLGMPLDVWIYLAKQELGADITERYGKCYPHKIYIENTLDTEEVRKRLTEVNGRPQRSIVSMDFKRKVIQFQGTSNEWVIDVPFSQYGKTWTLAEDELSRMRRKKQP